MAERCEDRKSYRARVQRAPDGVVLGSCFVVGVDDLAFVDDDTEWIRITKRKTATGLIIELGA